MRAGAKLTSLALVLILPSVHVEAQAPGGANSRPPAIEPVISKLLNSEIAAFKANPRSLLATYFSAGLPLSTRTRDLILTDNGLIDTLIDVAKNGNASQQAAIGAGLAQVAHIIARNNPQLAAALQQKIAESGLPQLITAFVAGSKELETTAVGGGGGGSGGGSGGQVGGVGLGSGSGGGSSGGASESTPNPSSDISPPGFSGFANTAGTGGATTTTRYSVSPS